MKFGPDQMKFSGGMIRWFFSIDGNVYQVNSQQYYAELPREEILAILYRHDRRRLTAWLEQREQEKQDAWIARQRDKQREAARIHREAEAEKFEQLRAQQRAEAYGQKLASEVVWPKPPKEPKLALSKRLRDRLRRYDERARLAPDPTLRAYATFVSDHHYIDAMFRLYSQQRVRLL